ncbi:hypothetical protein I7I48_11431 [Histoplasma ohiense]|nr:hypothetical protein I7I48_11431 [Histoplasma ohiense (nom. inval.)]
MGWDIDEDRGLGLFQGRNVGGCILFRFFLIRAREMVFATRCAKRGSMREGRGYETHYTISPT